MHASIILLLALAACAVEPRDTAPEADPDADDDGDPASMVAACARPLGYVVNGADCDDGDTSVHPGAEEIPGDGIDQGCARIVGDWPHEQVADFLFDPSGQGYSLPGPLDRKDDTLAGARDVDGDPAPDLAIGLPADGSGLVHIVSGAAHSSWSVADQAWTLTGQSQEFAGLSIAGGRDITGDDVVDLVAGSPAMEDGGALVGAAWIVPGPIQASAALADRSLPLLGVLDGWGAGFDVALAGDTDGYGIEDLLVGTPALDLYHQGSAFLLRRPILSAVVLTDADGILEGDGGPFTDGAGYSSAGAGDTNADGYGDVLIGPAGQHGPS